MTSAVSLLITVLAVVLSIVGLIWCRLSRRRPQANKKSAAGLSIVFIGGMFATVAMAWSSNRDGITAIVIAATGAALTLGLVAAGSSLAAMGMRQINHRPARYKHGFGQSMIAFVLGAGALGVTILGAARAVQTAMRMPEQGVLANSSASTRSDTSQLIPFPEDNFKFLYPGPPWFRLDPQKYSPGSALVIGHSNPDLVFIVNVSIPGVGSKMTAPEAAEMLKTRINATATESQWQEEGPKTISGIDGYRLYSRATTPGGLRLSYVHWLGPSKGRVYQLTIWGEQDDEAAVRLAADNLMDNFSELDPNKAAPIAMSEGGVTVFTSPRYRYTVRLPPGWTQWPDVQAGVPFAEFGALNGPDTGLYTAAMRVDELKIDFDALFTIAAAATQTPVQLSSVKPFKQGPIEAALFSYVTKTNGVEYRHRQAILRVNGLLFIANAFTTDPNKVQLITDTVNAIDLPGDAGTEPPPAMDRPSQYLAGLIFNNVGMACLQAYNRPQEAASLFERAMAMRPEEPGIANNLVHAQLAMNQPAQAAETAQRALERFPNNANLKESLAAAQRAVAVAKPGGGSGASGQPAASSPALTPSLRDLAPATAPGPSP